MISESERRKCEEEMREFCQGNIIIPDNVNLIRRGRIKRTITRKEPTKKKERMNIVASVSRIIGNILRK